MKNFGLIALALTLAVLLATCAEAGTPAATAPTQPPMADIGGTLVSPGATSLDLSISAYQLDTLVAAAGNLPNITQIHLGTTDLTAPQIQRIREAFPNAALSYSVSLFGQALAQDVESLDLSAMEPDQTEQLTAVLPLLEQLRDINFIAEDGSCVYSLDTIHLLDQVRALVPQACLRVCFDLFGQKVTWEDERIEYIQADIGSEGVEAVRSVLPYLQSCTYFLMDGCGVDDETMAHLRADFPDTKIVWRIWLMEPDYSSKIALRAGSCLTDTHRIRTTYVNDQNSHKLNYCTETRYVDVGHVWQLTQCDFLSYMPDLEACILAITYITDISPLANHEKLEYLELFTTDIADLSPLASCPNLEHLNISNMPLVSDISPLYGLTKLKRLRMVTSPLIPEAQKAEIAELLPECTILNMGYFPTEWGWRSHAGELDPRYALLREQMEYDIDSEMGIP